MENKSKVLALKYRPQNFQELIGQDIMVETIINSIKSNRIANAFLLTGVRGTGKTSTARIISKSLTCNGNFFENVFGDLPVIGNKDFDPKDPSTWYGGGAPNFYP